MAVKVGTQGNQNLNVGPKWFKGDPGGYYTPTVSEDGNLTWLPSEEDMPAVPGSNIAGPEGPEGKSGVWTEDTTPPEGYNVWIAPGGEASVTVTQEQMENYVTGEIEKIELMPGPQGEQGPAGADGADGISPSATIEQTDEGAVITIADATGSSSATLKNGATPVKGTDYWTSADKEEIVNEVLAALPAAEEVEV